MSTRNSRIPVYLFSFILAGISALGDIDAGNETNVMKVNRKGVISLNSETSLGNEVLEPGEYKVYCEHSESGHQVVFIRMQEVQPIFPRAGHRGTSDIHKASCRMVELPSQAQRTAVYTATEAGGRRYVQKVVIRGENVEHVFE
ncbi:MAG: hypothetical protein Kow001_05880 [Acidobacteriota bacterium]